MTTYAKALRMNVIAWSQNLTAEKAEAAGARLVPKDELMATADAISIHMVLSDRSRGLIGAADIARMKPGAILVNTSRGPIVDEAAMLKALHAGKIVAALDVYDREPLPVGSSAAQSPEHGAEPASGLLREGDVGRVLSADDRERPGVSGWQAGAGDQSGGAEGVGAAAGGLWRG